MSRSTSGKSNKHSDWSQIPYDQVKQMAASQNGVWNKIQLHYNQEVVSLDIDQKQYLEFQIIGPLPDQETKHFFVSTEQFIHHTSKVLAKNTYTKPMSLGEPCSYLGPLAYELNMTA